MDPATRKKLLPWVAAGFCAFVSTVTIVTNIILSFVTHTSVNDTLVFLCFMPMCFVFAGAAMYEMQREIRELKQQLGRLNDNGGNQPAE